MPARDGTGPRGGRGGGREGRGCGYRDTADCSRRGGRGRGDGPCRRENDKARTVRTTTVPVPAPATVQENDKARTARTTTSNVVDEGHPSHTSVAVCAEGPSMSDRVDDRFGRGGCFQLIDLETMTAVVISNDENRAGSEGAGIGAVELLVKHGAQAAIVTKVGPKAADAFRHTAIPVYTAAGLTVSEAVSAFSRGDLPRLDLG